MSRFPSLPLFTDAYIADTAHLTNEEHGAYLRLMMFAWRSPECRLPADDRRLALILGVSAARWSRLKPVVMAFWTGADGFWTQKRLRKEHDFVAEKVSKNRTNGKLGGRPKSLQTNDTSKAKGSPWDNRTANPDETQNESTHTHTHTRVPSEASPPQDAPAEAGPSPALSLKDRVWIEGKPALAAMGVSERQAGTMIGKWLRDTGGDAGRILWALDEARREATGNPVPYVNRILSNSPTTQRGRPNSAQPKDGIATLLRELEGRTHERDHDHEREAGRARPVARDRIPHRARSERLGDDGGPILDLEPIRPERG